MAKTNRKLDLAVAENKLGQYNTTDVEELIANSTGKAEDPVEDMTLKFKESCGLTRFYYTPPIQNLASYAVTTFVNKHGKTARDSRNAGSPPSTKAIQIDVGQFASTFCNVLADISIPTSDGEATGMIQAIEISDDYRVSICAKDSKSLCVLDSEYRKILEVNNFYQGKVLRYANEGLEFMPVPTTKMEDAVLDQVIVDELQLNVLDFLSKKAMHAITKKRGILIHGPPGTGKTTSIQALFRSLSEKKITCVHVSDASFNRHGVEEIFNVINTYLAPCLVAFEDIDLIASDRRSSSNSIIGPLLSAMNGIEQQKKPIVIMATTNRVDVLDEAITRPCRFDRKIKIDYPSNENLAKMFEKLAGFPPPKGLLKQSGKKNMTGAHIEEIFKTASMLAEQRHSTVEDCIDEAIETVKTHFLIPSLSSNIGFGVQSEQLYSPDDVRRSCRKLKGGSPKHNYPVPQSDPFDI